MEREKIILELTAIFREELDNDRITITGETSAKDIDEWDSLSNIRLIVAVEKHFKIRFNSQEIQEWKKIGDMVESIISKRN